MNLVEVTLRYEAKSDDEFKTGWSDIILAEWGLAKESFIINLEIDSNGVLTTTR